MSPMSTVDDSDGRRRRTTTDGYYDDDDGDDEDDNDDDGPRRRRSRRRRSGKTTMRRVVIIMTFIARGASPAKESQGSSGAEPRSQERTRAPPEAGAHWRQTGVHSLRSPEAGLHSPDYSVLALLFRSLAVLAW